MSIDPELLAGVSLPLAPAFIAAAVLGFSLFVSGTWWIRRAIRKAELEAADVLTAIAAGAASVLAGEGMWRVSRDILHLPLVVLLLTFAFLEIAVGASALRAQRNIIKTGRAGVDGLAVWTFTAISALLSAIDSRSTAEMIARAAIPFVAAWLWERGLHEEREAHRQALPWRVTLESLLTWLKIINPNPDATPLLTGLAVAIANHQRAGRMRRHFTRRRLTVALRRTAVATDIANDPEARALVLQTVGFLTSADTLTDVPVPSPWDLGEGLPSAEATPIIQNHQVEAELAKRLAQEDGWNPDPQTLATGHKQSTEWAAFRIRSARAIALILIELRDNPLAAPDLAGIAASFGKDALWGRARLDVARRLKAEVGENQQVDLAA
jgi:hypothetical protein